VRQYESKDKGNVASDDNHILTVPAFRALPIV